MPPKLAHGQASWDAPIRTPPHRAPPPPCRDLTARGGRSRRSSAVSKLEAHGGWPAQRNRTNLQSLYQRTLYSGLDW
jgi:hypothetical protein